MEKIIIYTDGGCAINPGGRGGYGVIIKNKDKISEYSEGYVASTNNRMELMAAIRGLEEAPVESDIILYSDSQYLINTMVKNWNKNANHDLWKRLELAIKRHNKIEWRWVKGHAGLYENERCDELAGLAMANDILSIDAGFTGKSKNGTKKVPYTGESTPPSCKDPKKVCNAACLNAIGNFYKKTKHSFKDYMLLKTYGPDGYSKMKIAEMEDYLGEGKSKLFISSLPDISSAEKAMRWHIRGLSIDDSIRKVMVDMEVSHNCQNCQQTFYN